MDVRNLMTTDVLTIGPDAPLKEAARRMIEAGISGLPVTDDGNLVGIITEADFVKTEADRRKKQRAGLLRFFTDSGGPADTERTVGDVMTPDVLTLSPDTDHAEAARMMQSEGVKRLPVVDNGKLVGLVSRTDMLKAFARPDADIINEIVDHVLGDVLWIPATRVDVACENGNVVLTGHLDTRSDADLLEALTRRLDGVVSVSVHLTYDVDNTKTPMTGPPMGVPRQTF